MGFPGVFGPAGAYDWRVTVPARHLPAAVVGTSGTPLAEDQPDPAAIEGETVVLQRPVVPWMIYRYQEAGLRVLIDVDDGFAVRGRRTAFKAALDSGRIFTVTESAKPWSAELLATGRMLVQ